MKPIKKSNYPRKLAGQVIEEKLAHGTEEGASSCC
jgi:hypothetical protein